MTAKISPRPAQALKAWLAFTFTALIPQGLCAETITADDPAFTYSGRIDFSDPQAPALMWSGTAVEFGVEGPSVVLILDDSTGNSFYQVIANGDDAHPVIIDCEKGLHSYPVELPTGTSRVLLFKRNEGTSGKTLFKGVELPEGASLLLPAPAPSRRIEFYGDSITCGMGNEAPDEGKDNDEAEKNNYMAYGAITARNLDAQYRCIARSGIGVVTSWFPLTMPEMYNRLDPNDPASTWDFSQWQPDVVVINLFQNDKWLTPKMDPVPTPDEIVAAYADFVSAIRAEYPDAHIVCALGSMDATEPGNPWPGYVEKAVAQLQAGGDENLSVCFFPFDGFRKHPRVRHHQRNAEILTAHIRGVTGW